MSSSTYADCWTHFKKVYPTVRGGGFWEEKIFLRSADVYKQIHEAKQGKLIAQKTQRIEQKKARFAAGLFE